MRAKAWTCSGISPPSLASAPSIRPSSIHFSELGVFFYGAISDAEKDPLDRLAREPVVRVEYVDEDGNEGVLYVTRGSHMGDAASRPVASYRSPLGRAASLPAGEEFTIPFGGQPKNVVARLGQAAPARNGAHGTR